MKAQNREITELFKLAIDYLLKNNIDLISISMWAYENRPDEKIAFLFNQTDSFGNDSKKIVVIYKNDSIKISNSY